MKTITAVTFFGILTYAFAEELKYGGDACQIDNVDGLVNLDPEKFFTGTWYLTHATPSTRVTKSTICRDYAPTLTNGKVDVTYSYNENGASGNRYNFNCNGAKNEKRDDIFNFICKSENERGETASFQVDVSFLATDYTKYGVLYRCVKTDTHFEDNVFLICRDKEPDENKVEEIKKTLWLE
uniref:Pc13, similar to Td18,triatin-like n=1 Tax=Panstrongylus chinai TaxID=156444 RepID=A0A286T527_9HEMI|nr:Pc13, similar to Td18,triatin-like [Panstrongylus chinai]